MSSKKQKSNKKVIIIIAIIAAIAVFVTLIAVMIKQNKLYDKYSHGLDLIEQKDWERAAVVFEELGDYKDSKDKITEIIYLSNVEVLESELSFTSLYFSDIKNSINNLIKIKDYDKANKALDKYYNKILSEMDKEKSVKNSVQKDYSINFLNYLNILDLFGKEDTKDKICEYATTAFNEGFVSYTITSNIKYNCKDHAFLDNSKYYKMTGKSWEATKKDTQFSEYLYFIQFLTTDVMTYEENYVSFLGNSPLKYSYFYKIYNDTIYVKKYKSDKYEKKFVITSLSDKSMKFKGLNYTYKAM